MILVEKCSPAAGVVEMEGTRCGVDLSLTPDATVGDYLVVHAGFAIERLDRDEADARLQLFADMADLQRKAGQ